MFSEITIENLRIFDQVTFKPSPGVNVVSGPNGAGKTTLLEAMHLVATGRSFRHRETSPMIRQGENYTQLVAKVTDRTDHEHVIGMRRQRSELIVRVDGRSSVRRSEILQLLPVHFIGADPQRLLTGPPELRRGFLDNGLFHVEPTYLKLIRSYGRVLGQRNAALRAAHRYTQRSEWDQQLIDFGTRITEKRQEYVRAVIDNMTSILQNWSLDCELSVSYRRGWGKQQELGEALQRASESDRRQQFTSVGPHRADLLINARSAKSGKVLSRGQLKMIVLALYLGQAEVQRHSDREVRVLLLDDLAAELDRSNREKVMSEITDFYRQIVATALDAEDLVGISVGTDSMFHVEHGKVSSRL